VRIYCWLVSCSLVISCTAWAQDFALPVDPGTARCVTGAQSGALENSALQFSVAAGDGRLRPQAFENRLAVGGHGLAGELFVLKLRNGNRLAASAMHVAGALRCDQLQAMPAASRAADQRAGVVLSARLQDEGTGMTVDWRLILHDSGNYVREEIQLKPAHDVDLAEIDLIDLDLSGASVAGTVNGSPIVADSRFFGFEHPMAVSSVLSSHATAALKRIQPLHTAIGASYSAVFGVAPEPQIRRAFLRYVENERAHPYRTFLHYNSWYDIGYFTPYSQDDALRAINAIGTALVRKRGVRVDSFLFDDGWDDTARLWQFHSGFPNGFAPVTEAAARFGAAPGVWLSPWGGYGAPRKARLLTAKLLGYEVDDQGLALSGPKYYALFHRVALDLLRTYGINQFKLDGTGSPDKVTPGSEFDSDFSAAIALINDLRQVRPELFINLTTGTWPSPFWLRTVDSIWRGGEDHEFAGEGSNRQRWMTYRDADTYGGIVRLGGLFPLNSLMLHGVIYARHAQGLNSDPGHDWSDEVWSYFASGTGLQELYISADLLSDNDWDELAAAAKWARLRAETLRDSHWIGGDPARGAVYGWASWSPGCAVIAIRNPGKDPKSYALDLASALELPKGAARSWRVSSPRFRGPPLSWSADKEVKLHLKPFEVQVWELRPQ
jgi:hypothetical protein